ncbi:MAG: cupin domain-containing protein [Planctomycetes bacterium]|nr:cupin domain-containing protein [Planctomycetota bacterium]
MQDAAEIVLSCRQLAQCTAFFAEVGFRLESVFPADDPREALLSGHGLAIRLQRGEVDGGGHLRIPGPRRHEMTAPNGTRLQFVTGRPARPAWQPATFFITPTTDAPWTEGRVGMLYRNLLQTRQDGSMIASRIRVPRGGPVPDYVHFHRVDAQIIYCRSGWVRVVYQDQGGPFVLNAGDCVLQPPGIRHRVLESSDELEVIEVTSPAEHETCIDHDLELPTGQIDRDREFGGQRFVRHQASGAVLQPWSVAGFDARDTGTATASRNAIAVRVVRPSAAGVHGTFGHQNDRRLWFVLRGAMTLTRGKESFRLTTDAACLLPPDTEFGIGECSGDLEFLEVARNVRHDP